MGTIKDLPIQERPREKAIKYGIDVLSDSELLAILLRSGTKKKTALETAMELICSFNGISNVFKASFYELNQIKGISQVKSLQILAIHELFVRILKNNEFNHQEEIVLTCPYDLYQYLRLKFESSLQEKLIVVYLNVKNVILFEEILTIGNDTMSVTNNKLICKHAIEKYAKKVVICHNHPSGDASPSLEDIATFYSLYSALKYIQVKLLDHIIFGKNEYYSIFNEKKYQVMK